MPKRPLSPSPSPTSTSTSSPTNTPSPSSAPPPSKYISISTATPEAVMQCQLPPHPEPLSFPTYEAYDVHYAQEHTNRCLECGRNFPSEHFLELHIGENHDPLGEVRRGRGERTYRCFLPDCERVCSAPHKRRLHLIDKHLFPKNYDFNIVNTGMDKRASMLRGQGHRRHSSAATRRSSLHQATDAAPAGASSNPPQAGRNEGPQISPPSAPNGGREGPSSPRKGNGKGRDEVDSLADSLSALRFVPPSVRFGRGGGRGGFARR